MQGSQNAANKYCPAWYKKPCGVAFGFGGKMLSFGKKKADAATGVDTASNSSFLHSLVVPNEPEVVPSADAFEQWIAERKLRDYCLDKTRRCVDNEHDALMWELMGTQFEDEGTGRLKLPALLGFDQDQIVQQAEKFLGKRP